MMRLATAIPFALIAFLPLAAQAADHTNESLAAIKKNLESNKAVLVDVRERNEWNGGHIEGAIFFPLSAVRDGLTELELTALPKDKIVYVHCAVGRRAKVAGDIFEKHGYQVRPMKPGFREMVEAGFPQAKD